MDQTPEPQPEPTPEPEDAPQRFLTAQEAAQAAQDEVARIVAETIRKNPFVLQGDR